MANLISSCSDDHAATDVLEVENHVLSRDDRGQSEYTSICSALLAEESVSSSFPIGFLSEIIDSKQCQTPESVHASIENQDNLQTSHVGAEKKLSSHNICVCLRCSIVKVADVVVKVAKLGKQCQTPESVHASIENQDNLQTSHVGPETPITSGQEEVNQKLFFSFKQLGVEKRIEKLMLNWRIRIVLRIDQSQILFSLSLKKKGKRGETQLSTSSKITFSPYKQPEEEMIASPYKENQRPPKFLQQKKLAIPAPMNQVKFKQDTVLQECKAERVPLQSLLVNFSGNSISVLMMLQEMVFLLIIGAHDFAGDEKRRWTMVADTASLVGKVSRKSLQLLQGLKGTPLVIPKMGK
uniref:Uncharacterized protein n=2 Tax=Salix viminalis TaxID=40686 RepID=A0A6N2LAG1_SALVM